MGKVIMTIGGLVILAGLAVALLICLVTGAWAAPYLVSDPVPEATSFQLYFDGATTPITVTPTANSIKYDLSAIANGAHTVKAKSCSVWGCSVDSNPFGFTKSIPAAPISISISAQ